MRQLLSGVVLITCAAYAAFNAGLWASRREVKTVRAAFNVLTLDRDVYKNSRAQLRDLRLLRSGEEVPYVLRTLSGGREEKTFRPELTDRVTLPGQGTQAVLTIGGGIPHNRVTIETDRTNFRRQVRIEASDDRKHWGMIRPDGMIFDISTRDQHASNLSVSYPESTLRFLRLTVEGWKNPEALRSVLISFVRESPAQRDIVADQQPKAAEDSRTRSTVLNLDLGFDRPFDLVRFDVAPGLFSRAVTVSVSHDRKNWAAAGFGSIERKSHEQNLVVTIPEEWTRYLRVTVSNEDNPPLAFSRLRIEAPRRELIFAAEREGTYWLYSGNPKAEPVRYDLATILPVQLSALPATIGPDDRNPSYQAPRPPVTERSPWLLSGLLVVLIPILGAIAVRMLRQVNTSE